MTGDESYHAHCFTCRTCKRRIDELVFAKTSQGIYCMVSDRRRNALTTSVMSQRTSSTKQAACRGKVETRGSEGEGT